MTLATSLVSLILAGQGFPSVTGADGHLHQPLKDAAGKPSVFIFISHDCPVCNVTAPEIHRVEAQFGSRVSIDVVYCDLSLSPSQARSHAKQYRIDKATLLLDPKCRVATFCRATVTPQAVVFDESGQPVYSGRIDDRYRALGQQRPAATTHDLAKALDSILNHKLPKPAAGPPVGCFIVFPNPS